MAINQPAANSTLATIQTKVRRLTRSPSEQQLTTSDLNQYINTGILYEFPEQLRLFNLRENLVFYTQPNVDTYGENMPNGQPITNPLDPLYDFTNRYITIHPPVYASGLQIQITQSEQQFFGWWPENLLIQTAAIGDGITKNFSGAIPGIPILQNQVNFTTSDALGNGMVLYDIPDTGTTQTGKLFLSGAAVNPLLPYGTINYITGFFTLDYTQTVAPAANVPIKSQTYPYVASIPTAMLYYNSKFQFRPVPDQPYKIEMEAYVQPTALLASTDVPGLSEWWEYISFLAAKRVFQDRMDLESVQLIMPELKLQERLILRRTLVQQSNERAPTIYNNNSGGFNRGNQYLGQY
jgi:hypothetical protein